MHLILQAPLVNIPGVLNWKGRHKCIYPLYRGLKSYPLRYLPAIGTIFHFPADGFPSIPFQQHRPVYWLQTEQNEHPYY